jgi:hypothetical protein
MMTAMMTAPSMFCLRFELESGGFVAVELPLSALHSVQKGVTFPSHTIEVK